MTKVRMWLRYAAIAGNVFYIAWIVYNGVDEGFRATPVHVAAYVGIIVLLALDAVLLWPDRRSRR